MHMAIHMAMGAELADLPQERADMVHDRGHRDVAGGPPKRILIIDDHAMMAQVLELGLADRGFECEIATVGSPQELCRRARSSAPDLVLLDLNLGAFDGLELIPRLRASGMKILVITGSTNMSRLAAALWLGSEGWVSKTEPFEELLGAVVRVLDGGELLSAERRRTLCAIGRQHLIVERDARARLSRLTAREREVLLALCAGGSVQAIATSLQLSVTTVRSHVQAVLSKLGVSTQIAAVSLAQEFLIPR